MLNKIEKIVFENKSSTYYNKLKEYRKYILKETSFLDIKSTTFNERVYCLMNNITEIKKCIECDNYVKFTNYTEGYKTYCSLTCSRSSKETLKKRQDTMLEKYGTLSPNRDKMKETNKKKYGTEYASSSKEIKDKVKKTNKERYGVDNVSKIKEVREKVKETNIKKFGVDCNLKLKSVQEKIKETNLKKYGKEYPTQAKIIKEKIKETNLKKYGVNHFTQSIEYKKQRYKQYLNKLDFLLKKNNLKRTFSNKFYFGQHKEGELNYNPINYSIKCLKCKELFNVILGTHTIPTHCYICEKQKAGTSKIEDELNLFLEETGIFYHRGDRKILNKLELDFYFPEKNFAIELNGLYYHSYSYLNKDGIKNEKPYLENNISPNKGKNFHLLKTVMTNKNKIKLLHIYEPEWLYKKEIVKSMIRYNLGLISNKINARECNVIDVSTEDSKYFLEKNHIQGQTNSSIRLGLEYKGELVSLMTFSKNRYSDEDYELVRFVNKINTNVRGGASKLFKHFKKNYKGTIMTFADRRYSNGNLYKELGFKEKYILPPQYKYFKNGVLYHRMFFQKKNIKKMYDNFKNNRVNSSGYGLIKKYNSDLTGEENLLINKVEKIYDSGHIKYIYNN